MSLIRHLAPGAAVTSALIGAMALAGWVVGMEVLKSVVPGQVAMKANTALSFMAVGFSLWVLSRDRPGRRLALVARAAALAVALFAAVTLTQYVHGHDLGIDQALFEEPAGAVGTSHPGRMAPNTAVAFMLIGTALILLDVRLRNWRPAPAMALLAAALGLLALLQYASGITNLYGVSTLTQMAIPTAFAFVVLGVGVVAARPEAPAMRLLCSETGGGRLVRGLLPVAVGLPLCLGAVRIAGEKAGLYPSATGSWLLATAYVALLVSAVWKVGRSLDRAEQQGAERARASIRDAEQRFRLLVDSVEDYAIFMLDPDGMVASWNAGAQRIKGYRPDEIIGRHFSVFFPPEDAETAVADPLAIARERGRFEAEAWRVRKDGSRFWANVVISAVYDSAGRLQGYAKVTRDMTERKRFEEQLAHQALHDPVTGLANRSLLDDRLGHALELCRRRRSTVGVLVIDLDRFKSVNDRLGHAAGDELLRAVARRIEEVSRTSDSIGRLAPETVARLGGDEFVVLCEDLRSEHDATRLADRIVAALAEPVAVDGGQEVSIRVSVGVSVARGGQCESEALIRQADAAKYRAKQRGGARFELFDETVRDQVLDRLDREKELRGALDRGEFQLVYQPIVATCDGRVVGVEALLRWHHPERGTVPPDQFIPLAEQTGLIVPIGRWALHQACRQAARWRSAHPNLSRLLVSVNLSARQFADPELTADVREAILQSGIDPGALCLEMTESALMDESERAVSILDGLRALGVRIALDDFGTGYSSLSYLQRFPLDGLKLDRSFMSGLTERSHSRAIVAAVIDMARTLGLRVVAEGVETEEQLADLRALESEFAQGYHFARPLPPEELGELFESGTVIERGRVVIPS